MERVEPKLEAVQRCPFCHDTIAADTEEQVACKRCLARHHQGCWVESGGCGSCRATEPLVAGPKTPSSDSSARVAQAFEESDREHVASRTLVWSILTFGLFGLFAAERAFSDHLAENGAELEELAESPELARASAEARPRAWRRWCRTLILIAAIVAATIGFLVTGACVDPREFADAWVFQLFAVAATTAYLHLFRETVQRHDRGQAFLRLAADAPAERTTRRYVKEVTRAWKRRRMVDLVVSLLGLVPGFGLVTIPLTAVRAFGALRQHEALEADTPKPRRRSKVEK